MVWNRQTGRRIALYVLTLQILVGIWLMVTWATKSRAPNITALAVLAWIGYMAANGIAQTPGSRRILFIAITIVSTVMRFRARLYIGAKAGAADRLARH